LEEVVKEFYDPIHGFIGLTSTELKVVDHPLFQRLRHIRQLGNVYLVYPGADHTRFSHSLGVMYIIDKMATKLGLENKQTRNLRMAALLHDIGHYPLSHTIESLMTGFYHDANHETLGGLIIKNTSLKDILKDNGYEPEYIINIFQGNEGNPLFTALLHSELDADRIDYLLRDSFYTGVGYGKIDLDMIIRQMKVSDEGEVYVDKKAKFAIENYLIGRYHMYQAVYTHKTVMGFDLLVQMAYKEMIQHGLAYSFDELRKIEEEELVNYSDHYFFDKLFSCKKIGGNLSEIARMLQKREVLKKVEEKQKLSRHDYGSRDYYRLLDLKEEEYKSKLADITRVPDEWILIGDSSSGLSEYKLMMEESGDRQVAIKTIDKSGEIIPFVTDKTSIINQLSSQSLDIVRIFTKKEYESSLKEGLMKYLSH